MSEFNTTSKLAVHLLREFCIGRLPATAVAATARAAQDDGWGNVDQLAQQLAKAGSSGMNPGNALRDVVKAAQRCGFMSSSAKPYIVDAPGPGGAPVKIEMFLPHEIYAALMQDADLRTWCLSPERLEQKLGKVLRDWAAHPDVQSTDDLTKVGMLGLHCDGAQYTSTMRAGGAKSVVVASINIVSAQMCSPPTT